MFCRVLNVPLDYLSSFAMILSGTSGKVWYMPNWLWHLFQAKNLPLFWNHTQKYNIQANERLAKFKEKWSTTQYVFSLSLILFIPMSLTVSAINNMCSHMDQMQNVVVSHTVVIPVYYIYIYIYIYTYIYTYVYICI